MASDLDRLNAGLQNGTLFDQAENKKDTTVLEDLVDVYRGTTNQLGLMPVAQGIAHALLDPVTTRLGGKGTADSNIDLSDKNFLERTLERFKYGYNTNKEAQEESMARNPLKYTGANIVGGFAIPAGTIGNVVTKPLGMTLTKATPTLSKVGNALTKEGAVKRIADNAIEGAIDSAMFSEEGEEGKNALIGGSIASAIPVLGASAKKIVPKAGTLLGANHKNLNRYSKKYPEIAEDLKNAEAKMENIESLVEQETKKLNTKYDSAIHNIGSSMADNTKKIVQEQDNLVKGVRNQLIDAYNDVDKKITQASYNARGNLRKDAFVDVTGIQKELDDIVAESKIQGKSYSASNDTSMKTVEQIRDDLLEIAKEGKISEKDLWRYMHDVLNPLAKYSNKELKGYTTPAVAVARKMRHQVNDLLKSANPKYEKAMKPTAEMTAFLNKELPEVLDLDNVSSLGIIRKLESNPDGLKTINKLANYAGIKLDDGLKRIFKVEKDLPSSFVGKDNLYMTGVLDKKSPDGLSVEQIQQTLKKYDSINGTDFSEQWNKARKEGKRDTVEAFNELKRLDSATDENVKGKNLIRKAFANLNPEEMDNQKIIDKVLEGNESNPLNEKLLKDRAGLKVIKQISDITGLDAKELERFGRNLSLDKALDTSATNGSRNTALGAAVGAGLFGTGQSIYNSITNQNDTRQPDEIFKGIPVLGSLGLGGALGAIVGRARDYGVANKLGKLAVSSSYNFKPSINTNYERLNEVLNNIPQSTMNRQGGRLSRNDENQKNIDNEIINFKNSLLNEKTENRIVPSSVIEEANYKNERYWGRTSS